MKKVLFVCLGNICRSPMAEAVFNDLVAKENLADKITSDSAGTANYHVGDAPDYRTLKLLAHKGIPSNHIGQQFNISHFMAFDYIIPMDKYNYEDILRLTNEASFKQKVILMRSFDSEGINKDVPDPYYGNMSDFEEVYEILVRSCKKLLDKIKKEL
ncbi:MAG: low molecular weight protein-tyrosine-phosphatase [Bacteroidota bacterium]|nr:low molecular weight protein-tyrosine-phosphatase [Bacteroidota bacterium]